MATELNLDVTSQFDGAVSRQLEKFRWPLSVSAHCYEKEFTPPCHSRLPCADNCLPPKKEPRFLLLDDEVFDGATFDDLAYCGCFHKAEVSEDSEKTLREILDLNAGVFWNIRNAFGVDCEDDSSFMKHGVVLEVVQERCRCPFGLSRQEHCGARHSCGESGLSPECSR